MNIKKKTWKKLHLIEASLTNLDTVLHVKMCVYRVIVFTHAYIL